MMRPDGRFKTKTAGAMKKFFKTPAAADRFAIHKGNSYS